MKLNSKEKDEELAERYNCTKCTVNLKDIKLKMFNFWKVVISEQDMLAANSVLAKQSSKSSNLINEQQTPFKIWKVVISEKDILAANLVLAKQSANSSNLINEQSYLTTKPKSYKSIAKKNNFGLLVNQKNLQCKRSKTCEKENNVDDEDDDIYKRDTFNLSQTENIFDKLDSLTDHEITYFNFTQVDDLEMKKVYKQRIDESVLLEKFKLEKNANDFDLKKNQIVWSQWKTKGFSIWWPAIVVKVVTNKNLSPRVYFRYYERIKKYGGLFGKDITKVEPFYWSTERHSYYKHLATQFKPQRYEFFVSYTNALVDFVKQSQEEEKGDEYEYSDVDMNASEDSTTEPVNLNSMEPKYLVNGQMLTRAKIIKLANKQPSKKTRKLIRERKKLSKSLIDIILSHDCRDYIISIIKNKIKCHRNSDYLNGTDAKRKIMRLNSTGPLLEMHQNEVKNFINQLSSRHFENKLSNLENYNNDVLYPEAVIWAIKIHCQLSDKKSVRKFHSGLGFTKWEILKEKCIEFLSKNPTISNQIQPDDNNDKIPIDKQNDLNSSPSHTEVDESEDDNNATNDDTLTSSDRNYESLSIPPSSHSQMMCEDEYSNDYGDHVYSYEYDLVDQTKSMDLK